MSGTKRVEGVKRCFGRCTIDAQVEGAAQESQHWTEVVVTTSAMPNFLPGHGVLLQAECQYGIGCGMELLWSGSGKVQPGLPTVQGNILQSKGGRQGGGRRQGVLSRSTKIVQGDANHVSARLENGCLVTGADRGSHQDWDWNGLDSSGWWIR